MAFLQPISNQRSKRYPFVLNKFTGGLNNRADTLLDSQTSEIFNMRFYDNDLMERRYGSKYYDEITMTKPIKYLTVYKPYADANQIVRVTENVVMIGNTTLPNSAGYTDSMNYQGKFYMLINGVMYVYGKFPQTNALPYQNVQGAPNANYCLFKVIQTPSTAVNANDVELGTDKTQGVTTYNYTTMEISYRPCANEKLDPYKGVNYIPSNMSLFVNFKGRLYTSGNRSADDTIYISDVSNPYYFPVSTSLQVPPNSDRVVGMDVYDDSVLIGRQADIYAIRGETNNPDLGKEIFTLKRINTHTGVASDRAMCKSNTYLFFFGSDGNAYALNSTASDENRALQTTLLNNTVDFAKSPFYITPDKYSNVVTYYDDDMWYVSFNEIIAVYSYRHQAWTVYDNLYSTSYCKIDNQFVWGDSFGRLATFDTTIYLDTMNRPYYSCWKSKWFDMGDPTLYKQFRDFYVTAHTYNEFNSDLTAKFEVDYEDVFGEFYIQNQIPRWGSTTWGDRFIDRNITKSEPLTLGKRGRLLRFFFENGYRVMHTVFAFSDLANVSSKIPNMVCYVINENKYYLFSGGNYTEISITNNTNQALRVYQIYGEYDNKGRR